MGVALDDIREVLQLECKLSLIQDGSLELDANAFSFRRVRYFIWVIK